jgi:hypothetical protein
MDHGGLDSWPVHYLDSVAYVHSWVGYGTAEGGGGFQGGMDTPFFFPSFVMAIWWHGIEADCFTLFRDDDGSGIRI